MWFGCMNGATRTKTLAIAVVQTAWISLHSSFFSPHFILFLLSSFSSSNPDLDLLLCSSCNYSCQRCYICLLSCLFARVFPKGEKKKTPHNNQSLKLNHSNILNSFNRLFIAATSKMMQFLDNKKKVKLYADSCFPINASVCVRCARRARNKAFATSSHL